MKKIAALSVFALVFLLGAGNSGSSSGLRGTVVLDPGYPVCQIGTSCTRPAAHVLLRFWRSGQLVAQARTDSNGQFRIGLRPRTYRVSSKNGTVLTPARVTVATGGYRRVTFKLDVGIR